MSNILVIEDNEDIRETISEILEVTGYQVLTARNGKVGIEKIKQELPDLIICDVLMPELDGYGVLNFLNEKIETAKIPFIFLTAKADQRDVRKGMGLGADDYLIKPFTKVDLIDAIETRIKKAEQMQAAFEGNSNDLDELILGFRGKDKIESSLQERGIRRYKNGEKIYEEGDVPNCLYMVVSGEIQIVKTNEKGQEFSLQSLKPGSFFGHFALLKDQPYSESAIAINQAEISLTPKADFFALLFYNKDFSSRFLSMLADNASAQQQQILQLAFG